MAKLLYLPFLFACKSEGDKVELAHKFWLGRPVEDAGDGEELVGLVEAAHVLAYVRNKPLAVRLGLKISWILNRCCQKFTIKIAKFQLLQFLSFLNQFYTAFRLFLKVAQISKSSKRPKWWKETLQVPLLAKRGLYLATEINIWLRLRRASQCDQIIIKWGSEYRPFEC